MPSFTLPFVFLAFKSYIALTGSSVVLVSRAFFTASSTASLLFLAPFPKFRLTLVQSKGLAVKRSTRWDLLRKGAPKSFLWFLGERAKNLRYRFFFLFYSSCFFPLGACGSLWVPVMPISYVFTALHTVFSTVQVPDVLSYRFRVIGDRSVACKSLGKKRYFLGLCNAHIF